VELIFEEKDSSEEPWKQEQLLQIIIEQYEKNSQKSNPNRTYG
jgi:hypothetical protein